MYNPPRYQTDDSDEAFQLMERYPFATLISVVDGKAMVSQLPITPKKIDDNIQLLGHLAKANPHSKVLAIAPVTILFSGPHTYMTPQWYVTNNVPTWNYASVQVTGDVKMLEGHDQIIGCLKDLTTHVETHWPSGWEFFIPPDLSGDRLAKNIVGFKVTVDTLSFKKKLSQTLNPADRAGVLQGLALRNDDNSRQVLVEMQKIYSANGEKK